MPFFKSCVLLLCSLKSNGQGSSRNKLSPHSMFLGQQRTKNEALAEGLGLPKQAGLLLVPYVN
jgi:ribosomal protein L27